MRKATIVILSIISLYACCERVAPVVPGELNLAAMIRPVPMSARFEDPDYYTWGTSAVKGDDGLYHAFYSRWPAEKGKEAWVTDSEIAHAVADNPFGPYRFTDVALAPRGAGYWDGLCTHNPTIHRFGNRYYLYYMGNTGDGMSSRKDIGDRGLNWIHRNNQRIGVAVSDSPYGPWTRSDRPLIDVTDDPDASDALLTSNPSVAMTPDGRYIMVYKAVAKQRPMPFGGPVSHRVAFSDNPTGPFVKEPGNVFTAEGSDFPAEDPYIWCQDNCLYAIVKDMHGAFTNSGRSLALFYSTDGRDWKPAANPLVSVTEIVWEEGPVEKVSHLERPQLLIENGKPVALFLAADHEDTERGSGSFNVQLPLQ